MGWGEGSAIYPGVYLPLVNTWGGRPHPLNGNKFGVGISGASLGDALEGGDAAGSGRSLGRPDSEPQGAGRRRSLLPK